MLLILLAFIALLGVESCKKKSSDSDTTTATTTPTYPTTVTGVALSSKVSVVDPKDSKVQAQTFNVGFTELQAAIDVNAFAADAEYNKDQTEIFVHEKSAEGLNTVNMILCYMGQLKFADATNKEYGYGAGIYRAQVDEQKCESKGGAEKGKSKGGGGVTYTDWIVKSLRAAGTDTPQEVNFWRADAPGGEDSQYITGKLSIAAGPSATNPFGLFTLQFKGTNVNADGTEGTSVLMKGYITTKTASNGGVDITYFNEMDGAQFGLSTPLHEKVAFNWTKAAGSGTTTGIEGSQAADGTFTLKEAPFNFAFNDAYFYRENPDATKVCLDRNSFNEMAWAYGMYDSAGKRVSINSGFPIKASSGGKEVNGYVGYWGLWVEDGVKLSNGDTVTKVSWDPNVAEVNYKLFIANGRLEKKTKVTTTLADIANIPLSAYDFSAGGESRVHWDNSKSVFVKDATRSESTNWVWKDLATPVNLTFSSNDFAFFFYSQALGGDGMVKLINEATNTALTLSGTSSVIFHTSDLVYPGDTTIPSSLVCFENCPDPSSFASGSGTFTTTYPQTAPTHTYTWDSTTNMLKTSTGTAVDASAAKSSSWSGALVDSSTASTLKCPWDSTQYCGFLAWEKATTFYTWSTGPEDWNRFTALTDTAGKGVAFDEPLMVKAKYVNTASKYNGTTFYLEYGGFGNLWGLPTKCVDPSSGNDTSCSEDAFWIPEVILKNGTQVTDVVDATKEYVVKALEMEQQMKSVAESTCTGAGLTLSAATLPDISGWTDPALGTAPSITGVAAVVGGEIKVAGK